MRTTPTAYFSLLLLLLGLHVQVRGQEVVTQCKPFGLQASMAMDAIMECKSDPPMKMRRYRIGSIHGKIKLAASSFLYAPNKHYHGPDTITIWERSTKKLVCRQPIMVLAPDCEKFQMDNPVPRNMMTTCRADRSIDPRRLVIRAQHGVISTTDSSFTYTPVANFTGRDTVWIGAERTGKPLCVKPIEVKRLLEVQDVQEGTTFEIQCPGIYEIRYRSWGFDGTGGILWKHYSLAIMDASKATVDGGSGDHHESTGDKVDSPNLELWTINVVNGCPIACWKKSRNEEAPSRMKVEEPYGYLDQDKMIWQDVPSGPRVEAVIRKIR